MAHVTGPLHSFSASGQLAKSMIFQSYHGKTYVKNYAVPRNDRTPKEIGIRAMVYYLTKLWATLTTPQRASWLLAALEQNLTPFNVYFTENMKRWKSNLGPMKSSALPPYANYGPTLALEATGGAGQVALSIMPATLDLHVNISAGTTEGSPNPTGCYVYIGDNNGQAGYRRSFPTPSRVFWTVSPNKWNINNADSYSIAGVYWNKSAPTAGDYTPQNGATGNPVGSAELDPGPANSAVAVAIFRKPTAFTIPTREICIAVLTLDGSGNANYSDTGQVGGKAGPPGGLTAGEYYYMAVPLSLDGRLGEKTDPTAAFVT